MGNRAAAPCAGAGSLAVRCKLVTPMYGGGVEPGVVDCDMPIRAGALRGHLRFWWRLLNSAGGTPEELFSREAALWGGLSSTGPKASRVTLQIRAEPVRRQQLVNENFPAYALILEQGNDPELLAATYRFELELRCERPVEPEQRGQIIEALRWWVNFGGVGARTRRGFGAVKASSDDTDLPPVSAAEVEQRRGWMITGRPTPDAFRAWSAAIDALKRFRQGPGIGRNRGAGGGGRPGRSHWPEPDALRRSTGRYPPRHDPQHPVDGYYPRAAFGLPLVFHFKDRKDPPDKTLKPSHLDRMASPLILRPWFDGRQYCPAALLLPGWEKRVSIPVHFDDKPAKPAWPEEPEERKRLAAQIQPMKDAGTDALSAFMKYFARECGKR